MRGNSMSSKFVLFTLVAGMSMLASTSPVEAEEVYRSFCASNPTQCPYTGPDAPVLRADVCWNQSVATLKGTAPCQSGSWAYHVDFGDVDPISGVVQAVVPLDDACDLGFCTDYAPTEPTWSDAMCCTTEQGESCVPKDPYSACDGTIVFCEDMSSNGDGTVTCHDEDEEV